MVSSGEGMIEHQLDYISDLALIGNSLHQSTFLTWFLKKKIEMKPWSYEGYSPFFSITRGSGTLRNTLELKQDWIIHIPKLKLSAEFCSATNIAFSEIVKNDK